VGCHLTFAEETGCSPSRTWRYETGYCRWGLGEPLAAMRSSPAGWFRCFVHTFVKRATARWSWERAGGRQSLPWCPALNLTLSLVGPVPAGFSKWSPGWRTRFTAIISSGSVEVAEGNTENVKQEREWLLMIRRLPRCSVLIQRATEEKPATGMSWDNGHQNPKSRGSTGRRELHRDVSFGGGGSW
jgi:hypothetical protein